MEPWANFFSFFYNWYGMTLVMIREQKTSTDCFLGFLNEQCELMLKRYEPKATNSQCIMWRAENRRQNRWGGYRRVEKSIKKAEREREREGKRERSMKRWERKHGKKKSIKSLTKIKMSSTVFLGAKGGREKGRKKGGNTNHTQH